MATRKTGGLDPQIVREIEKQTQKQQEIDNKRTKQKLIFWSLLSLVRPWQLGLQLYYQTWRNGKK